MHKGQSIYPTEDQTYPGGDGDRDDEETESSDEDESSDEEVFVKIVGSVAKLFCYLSPTVLNFYSK